MDSFTSIYHGKCGHMFFLEHSVLGQGSGLVVKKTARKYSQLFPIVGYYVEEV